MEHTDETVLCVSVSPDGKTVAAVDDSIRLWDLASGKVRKRFPTTEEHRTGRATFTPDGKTLASCGFASDVRLWDVENGLEKAALKTGGSDPKQMVAVSRDGRFLAAACDDGILKLGSFRRDLNVDQHGSPQPGASRPRPNEPSNSMHGDYGFSGGFGWSAGFSGGLGLSAGFSGGLGLSAGFSGGLVWSGGFSVDVLVVVAVLVCVVTFVFGGSLPLGQPTSSGKLHRTIPARSFFTAWSFRKGVPTVQPPEANRRIKAYDALMSRLFPKSRPGIRESYLGRRFFGVA